MKTYLFGFILGFFIFCFPGCNTADDISELQQEYLYAEIDGEQLAVDNTNGIVRCQKLLSDYGTVNLSLKVERLDGKVMELLILNYSGKKNYPIEIPNISNGESYENMNWMNYAEMPEGSFWSTRYNKSFNLENPDYIEITEDNGMYLKGRFSFVGHSADGTSILSVTNGDFNVELDN